MFSYLFFAIILLSVFSIVENLKGNQKFSIIKLHILVILFFLTGSSLFSFLDEIGYQYILLISLFRLLGAFSLINLYYIIAFSRVKLFVYIVEASLLLVFSILAFYGFEFLLVKQGVYNVSVTLPHKITLVIITMFMLLSLISCSIQIYKKTDDSNLYQQKIKRWSMGLFAVFLIFLISVLVNTILFTSKLQYGIKPDTRLGHVISYFILLFFILARPKFLDEAGFAFSAKHLIPSKTDLTSEKFDFVFYANQYYLKPEAHIDDFSLILNFPKIEVINYIEKQTDDSFNELVNRHRIKYFKDLLQSKKYESFTIEALSELSGFNNRRTMYNAYKKYEGGSPTDFINSLK
jgi:hypothetical protein